MVKLPTSDRLQTRRPQSTMALQNVDVPQEYSALQSVSQSLGRVAQQANRVAQEERRVEQQRQAELEKFEITRQKSHMINQFNTTVSTVSNSPDYHNYDKLFNENAKSIQDNLSNNEYLKGNDLASGYLQIEYDRLKNDARLKVGAFTIKKQNDATAAAIFDAEKELMSTYASSDSKGQQEIISVYGAMNLSAVKTGAISRVQASQNIYNFKLNSDRNFIESLPPEKQLDVITGEANTDDAIVDLKIAKIESNFKPDAKNPKSSAGGLYQQIDANAQQYGVKDRLDAKQSYDGYLAEKKQIKSIFQKKFKRQPKGWEIYLTHQQGIGGAPALIANPEKGAIEVLTDVYKSKAKARNAVLLNGGKEDMTARQFSHLWRDKYNETDISDAPTDIVQLVTGGKNGLNIPLSEQTKILTKATKDVEALKEKSAIDTASNFVLNQFPDDYKSQVGMINSMDNLTPSSKKSILSILDGRHRQQENIRKDEARENSLKVLDVIDQGGSLNDVPPDVMLQLPSKDRAFLEKYYDKKNFTAEKKELSKKQETLNERLLYAEVQDAYYNGGIDALKEYDVARLAGELNESQFNKYRSWLKPPEDASPDAIKANRQQINTIFKDTSAILGINDKNDDDIVKQSILREQIETQIEQFTMDNQRPPKYTEVLEIKNKLIREVTTKEGFIWDTKKRIFEATPDDLKNVTAPDADKEQILKALQKRNPNALYSDAQINDIYRASLKK
jgi:hypothetical protein